jgi:calcium-dependent protein kinase
LEKSTASSKKQLFKYVYPRDALIKSEKKAMKKLQGCPNVIMGDKAYGVGKGIGFFMSMCNEGDLDQFRKKKSWDESEIRGVIGQILMALEWMHNLNFAHCDVKCSNILIDIDDAGHVNAYLSDFGLMQKCETVIVGARGTSGWQPPEIVKSFADPEHTKFDEKAEIWSLAVVMFMLYTGTHPFPGGSWSHKCSVVGIEDEGRRERMREELEGKGAGKSAIDLIFRMFRADPKERISAGKALNHPFFDGWERRAAVVPGSHNSDSLGEGSEGRA